METGLKSGFQIVAPDNGAGLTIDAQILLTVGRESGIPNTWRKRDEPSVPFRAAHALGIVQYYPRKYAVNVFLESFHHMYFPMAATNVLIPNPEWFPMYRMEGLPGIDVVLCKTYDALHTFSRLGADARYIGFTSRDIFQDPLAASRDTCALHIAGQSALKGTRRLLRVWRKHREWPMLTVVQRTSAVNLVLDTEESPNIRMLAGRVPEAELLQLIRTHPVHILPSEVEGFGQALVEGMSAGAVVVTTNGAPMNEIVTAGRGVLVEVASTEPMALGKRHFVDEFDLEHKIANVLGWSREQRIAVGAAAREWYKENDARFRRQFVETLRSISEHT